MQRIVKQIITGMQDCQKDKQRILLAIDGRCAAGKTTLAAYLQHSLQANVFHMDDFFLQPFQRTSSRLQEPGGNIDHERFLKEILMPVQSGKAFAYCPYDCKTQTSKEPVTVYPHDINIVEGSYSCHPALRPYYDMCVFLTIPAQEQLRRLAKRDISRVRLFQEQWIPLEELYFSAFQVEAHCDITFDTTGGEPCAA